MKSDRRNILCECKQNGNKSSKPFSCISSNRKN
ncbi:unnamed protein product [Ceutorhynchus assimilis]|uniref:Uncharacterized protein n=1 Tax=Ceutorhynchus assimilis TaxID=467358 RepID=A0A9N9QT45_9CUCU|nr:unnamed protein product [Ceutorhynchus assimilis]